MKSIRGDLFEDLVFLYGRENGKSLFSALEERLDAYQKKKLPARPLDQRDIFLITYGDQFQPAPGTQVSPLQALLDFCGRRLKECVNTIHILPFYPYSSDDGFSVLDYHAVNPALGGWEDIHAIGRQFKMMFDLVINHISVRSAWFQAFLAGDESYQNFFIIPPADADLSAVVRPRTSPLLTGFQTSHGEEKVWTTFSADQADLNYHNPQVLLAVLDVILDYAGHGATYLRLDAVAFMWKEFGSTCLNLPQTHALIRIMRRFLDLTAPHIRLITETNIPHEQNISYFGDGRSEAQLVYNFALPPLMLHALLTERVDELRDWAAGLSTPTEDTAFFNFLASHDGIGLNPARGILTEEQISGLVDAVTRRGGLVSNKTTPDGGSVPYELNINYFDALTDPESGEKSDMDINRYLVSQAVLLALKGVPAVYAHSLLGSRGWREGPALTGQNRSINREKLQLKTLEMELDDLYSLRGRIFNDYRRLLSARRCHPAFSPRADQVVLDTGSGVFSLLRRDKITGREVICCHNFTGQVQSIDISREIKYLADGDAHDMVYTRAVEYRDGYLTLDPYQILWMTGDPQ